MVYAIMIAAEKFAMVGQAFNAEKLAKAVLAAISK